MNKATSFLKEILSGRAYRIIDEYPQLCSKLEAAERDLATYRDAFEATSRDRDLLLKNARELFKALGEQDLSDSKLRSSAVAILFPAGGGGRKAPIQRSVRMKIDSLLAVEGRSPFFGDAREGIAVPKVAETRQQGTPHRPE